MVLIHVASQILVGMILHLFYSPKQKNVNTKREKTKVQNIGVDFDPSIYGATYVPVNIRIKFE